MTHNTVARRCPKCSRILFITRDGLWPRHFTTKRSLSARVWCGASATKAPLPKGPVPRMGAVR